MSSLALLAVFLPLPVVPTEPAVRIGASITINHKYTREGFISFPAVVPTESTTKLVYYRPWTSITTSRTKVERQHWLVEALKGEIFTAKLIVEIHPRKLLRLPKFLQRKRK